MRLLDSVRLRLALSVAVLVGVSGRWLPDGANGNVRLVVLRCGRLLEAHWTPVKPAVWEPMPLSLLARSLLSLLSAVVAVVLVVVVVVVLELVAQTAPVAALLPAFR